MLIKIHICGSSQPERLGFQHLPETIKGDICGHVNHNVILPSFMGFISVSAAYIVTTL